MTLTQYNVLAELPGKLSQVVVVGAHPDCAAEGPGIQDNGSGSAAILQVALQMAKVRPRNTVRFAWWGAEEAGPVGSTSYVGSHGCSHAPVRHEHRSHQWDGRQGQLQTTVRTQHVAAVIADAWPRG